MADGGGQALQGLAAIGTSVKRTAAGAVEAAPVPKNITTMKGRTTHATSGKRDFVTIPRGFVPSLEMKHGERGAYQIFMAFLETGLTGATRRRARLSLLQRASLDRVLQTNTHTKKKRGRV